MTQQGMTWQELLDQIARRAREPDLATTPVTSEQQTPYFEASEVERLLYRVSLSLLRAMSEEDLEATGAKALVTSTLANNGTVPLNAYGIAGATIQMTLGGVYTLADFVTPAQYFEQMTIPATAAAIYTFYGGQVKMKGNSIKIVFRVEPSLADFQNDEVILPAEHNEDQIDRVHKLMLVQDFLPMGRM